MKIQFFGAARGVTGSKHVVQLESGTRFLLDCGLFQGKDSQEHNHQFGFDPSTIDFVILSHAHIDHSGLIPRLVKQGFSGKIYCTSATRDLCNVMLEDSAHIQENDVKYINQRRMKRGENPLEPLYSVADTRVALQQFVEVPYNTEIKINEEVKLLFTDAGHILGSAMVNLSLFENGKWKNVLFTGDIGRYKGSILKDPEPVRQAELILMESTYGDRKHDDSDLSSAALLRIIQETCVHKKGKLVIPAFSLGRTQELVYALDQLENAGKLPRIPVFVDSPLSINATNIMRSHPECFNESLQEYLKKDSDPFGFNKLFYIQDVQLSKKINESNEPCIIISASGMAEAGRIKHHLANTISNPLNTILLVGYAEPFSLAGKIKSGAKKVTIFGDEFSVKADVEVLDSYSAHADYEEMIEFLSCQDPDKVKKIILVHGEYETQLHFESLLNANGFKHIHIPAFKDVIIHE